MREGPRAMGEAANLTPDNGPEESIPRIPRHAFEEPEAALYWEQVDSQDFDPTKSYGKRGVYDYTIDYIGRHRAPEPQPGQPKHALDKLEAALYWEQVAEQEFDPA